MNFLNLFDKSYYILFVWTETENDFGSDCGGTVEKKEFMEVTQLCFEMAASLLFYTYFFSYVNYKNACNKSAVMVRYIYVR